MDELKTQVDLALRRGDARTAAMYAGQWANGSTAPARDTAIEIAKVAGAVYRDLIAEPVHEFVELVPDALPTEMATIVTKAVGRLIAITKTWDEKLRLVQEERFSRDLRDQVRAKDYEAAKVNVGHLMRAVAKSGAEAIAQRARYIGTVLGTCVSHPREADALIAALRNGPEVGPLKPPLIDAMQEAKNESHRQMMSANLSNVENQWVAQLKGVQVEIMQALPGKNVMGDPEEADLRDAGDLFRSILRVPLWRKDPSLFVDATLLLVDFTPKPLAAVAKASGVEGRSYAELGFRAKKAVALVLMEIGKIKTFTTAYKEWATGQLGGTYGLAAVQLMGELRSDDFGPFLLQLWNTRQHRVLRPMLSVALANLATPDAAWVLIEEYKSVASASVMDANTFAESKRLLEGLGRIVRSPRTADDVRAQVIARTIDATPRQHLNVVGVAIAEVASARPEHLTPQQRQWALTNLVDILFVPDQSTAHHKGDERAASLLGDRAPIAAALKRLGAGDVPHLLAEFERHSIKYSGALIGVAEVLQELNDPSAVPLLAKMLLNALMHDTAKANSYQQETYWDPSAMARRPLTKDLVCGALIFAIGTLGGDEATKILKSVQVKLQSGRIDSPGTDSMNYLAKFLGVGTRDGGGAAASATSKTATESFGATDPLAVDGAKSAANELDPGEVKTLIKAITASYFLTGAAKRAQAKITALARLGQLAPSEAIEPIARNLADKDAMVRSAAIMALAECGSMDRPAYQIDETLNAVVDSLRGKDRVAHQSAIAVLREMGMRRVEVRRRVGEFAKEADTPELKIKLKELMDEKGVSSAEAKLRVDQPPAGENDSSSAPATSNQHKADLKREYFRKRQEWIAGGKRGDPPQPPPGI